MRRFLTHVRDDERQETRWALVTIFLVLMAHAILETARDTLFLSHLPTNRLPWVYLALAVLALLATRAFGRSAGPRGDLRQLITLQIVAAAGTLIMLVITRAKPPWALYALYIWGGLASTLILIRFWLVLTDRFTIAQAKRLFPLIAAGPLLGSLVGYGLAGLLCRLIPPVDLLGVSATLFLFSAGGSLLLWRAHDNHAPAATGAPAPTNGITTSTPEPRPVGVRESVVIAVRHRYVRRVALVLVMASVTVTLVDFIFKTVVAREIQAARLGSFLAMSYFIFDLVALALLFTAVVPFVRSRGVNEALAVQPVLLLLGGVLLVLGGGLVSVMYVRGIDGALRWSLHKTATELLYVPLSARLRSAVKALSDIVAHRGGQALGSIVILSWLALAPSEPLMGLALVGCAGVWTYLALSLRQPYLDLFRETLSQRAIETRLTFPDLDMASLETLIAALSSLDEPKVLAALDLLQQSGRVHLAPALILYHPSPAVVLRALELFTTAKRRDILALAEHLLEHRDTAVRAASIRACAVLQADTEVLRRASDSDEPSVAVTAMVALAARRAIEPESVKQRLEPFLAAEGADADEVRRFLARALRDPPQAAFAPLLERLAAAPDSDTRREAVHAMGAAREERHLPVLVGLLATPELRETVREALLAYGPAALAHLRKALADLSLPRAVRVHLPRTISRFPTPEAAHMLVSHLPAEPSGRVRYKILRGLGRMVANYPELELPPEVVDQVIDRQLAAILQNLHWQVVLQADIDDRPEHQTTGHELLIDLLQQKEALAVERLFRALGLRYRDRDMAQIYAGLQSADEASRANCRELLQGVLPAALRKAVVGLTEEEPPAERLAAARGYYDPEPIDYETLLMALVSDSSESVSCIASFHAAELGLVGARQPMAARQFEPNDWPDMLRRRSFEIFRTAAAASGRASA